MGNELCTCIKADSLSDQLDKMEAERLDVIRNPTSKKVKKSDVSGRAMSMMIVDLRNNFKIQ